MGMDTKSFKSGGTVKCPNGCNQDLHDTERERFVSCDQGHEWKIVPSYKDMELTRETRDEMWFDRKLAHLIDKAAGQEKDIPIDRIISFLEMWTQVIADPDSFHKPT